METNKGTLAVTAKDAMQWRRWLQENHLAEKNVWLIIYRKESGIPSIYYEDAVEQALCFGWVDAVANKRDTNSYYLYFSKRKPKSNWSKPNRERVEKLISKGIMTPAGMEMVNLAKNTGTWEALMVVERFELPPAMQAMLKNNELAQKHWNAFPPSTKRGILEWIISAKTPATTEKRIVETVSLAEKNIRANQYQPRK